MNKQAWDMRSEFLPAVASILVLGALFAGVIQSLVGPQTLQARAVSDLRVWLLAINQYRVDHDDRMPLDGYHVGYGEPRKLEGWPSDGKIGPDDPCVDPPGEYKYVPYYRVLKFQRVFTGLHTYDVERDPVVRAPGCRVAPTVDRLEYIDRGKVDTWPRRTQWLSIWMDGHIDWSWTETGWELEFASNRGLLRTRGMP